MAALMALVFILPAGSEGISLDEIMREIDEQPKGLNVGPLTFDVSEDRQHVFINRPEVSGSDDYTIAYNIYDADSNPVNYFYSAEERVAATPGYGGLFNVFVVVTDTATGESVTQNIGWHQLTWPYAENLTVGQAAFEVSPDRRSIYVDRPDIRCRSGEVTIAYNIYDADSNPVNYFYSTEKRVAATPGYDGRFNVFIMVTDTITGEQDVQNIGWTALGEEGTETDEELMQVRQQIPQGIHDAITDYLGSNGYVEGNKRQDAIQAVGQYIAGLHEQGYVTDYAVEKYGVSYIDAAMHELWIWNPSVEDMMSGSNDGKIIVYSMDAFAPPSWDTREQMETYARQIVDGVDDTSLVSQSRKNVTIDAFASIGANQIVLLHTHGGYCNGIQALATGTLYDASMPKKYRMTIPEGELLNEDVELCHIVLENEWNKDYLAITARFIRNRCGDLSNSFIYLGACHSADSDGLFGAFSCHNATAIIGYTMEVNRKYQFPLLGYIIEHMLDADQGTGHHYTLGEALAYAQDTSRMGPADRVDPDRSMGSTAIIRGYEQRAAENYSFYPLTIEGFIYEADSGKVPIDKVTIELSNDDYTVQGFTDQEGHFRMTAPEGQYTATLKKDGYKIKTIKVSGKQGQMINAEWTITPCVMSGYVVLSDTHELPEGVVIASGREAARTDSKGYYEMKIPRMQSTVTFSYKGCEDAVVEIDIKTNDDISRNIALKAYPGYLTGYVLDQDGSALEDVSIYVYNEQGQEVRRTHSSNTGSYTLELKHGVYTVKLVKYITSAVSYETQTITDIRISRGETLSRHFTLYGPWPVVINGIIYNVKDGEVYATGHEKGLTELVFADEVYGRPVTGIGAYAFNASTTLSGPLKLPKTLKTIEHDAFDECNVFEGALVLPETLVTIGAGAFCYCSCFTGNLVIPDSVETIGANAFRYCGGFKSLSIGSGVKRIGSLAFSSSGFTGSLTIPGNVETIGESAFMYCTGFNGALVISEGVADIERAAFLGSSFHSLSLPRTLRHLGREAFEACSAMSGTVHVPLQCTVEENAFLNTPLTVIYD